MTRNSGGHPAATIGWIMICDDVSLRVADVTLHTHSLPMRIPFNVAGARLETVEQITVEVRVIGPTGACCVGRSADSPAAIWFDKDRPAGTVRDDLFAALESAASVYRAMPPMPAFALACHGDAAQEDWRRDRSRRTGQPVPETIAAFGCALLDRAILDALCKLSGLSFFDAIRRNLPGIDARLTPDLRGRDLAGWLASLSPRDRIAIRHTVTGFDQITASGTGAPPQDGLPFFLADVVRTYGNRYFKIKMTGDFDHNVALFTAIAQELIQTIGADWAVTLDCNECFATAAEFSAMTDRLARTSALRPFWDRVLYFEQPVSRRSWRNEPVTGAAKPVIIDETEGSFSDAPLAFDLGYRGVSAKSVKGVYKAILNAARAALLRSDCFVTGEDMNHPAGLALQQDIAVAMLLGLPHAEKNGHHFIGPVAADGDFAPCPASYPETYIRQGREVGLNLTGGVLRLGKATAEADFVSRVSCAPISVAMQDPPATTNAVMPF